MAKMAKELLKLCKRNTFKNKRSQHGHVFYQCKRNLNSGTIWKYCNYDTNGCMLKPIHICRYQVEPSRLTVFPAGLEISGSGQGTIPRAPTPKSVFCSSDFGHFSLEGKN